MNKTAHLYVVGIGPGDSMLLTPEAAKAIALSDCIAGYSLYLDLLPQQMKAGKTIIESGMKHERERCQRAIQAACGGCTTAFVCSGDPGIYAMASLVLEILEKEDLLEQIPLTIVPGVPALCAAAARLGAPLAHDFACISLSDLLTPWRVIEKRIQCGIMGDFVCVLYNPRSHGRPHYLEKVMEMVRAERGDSCPVGLAKNIARKGEKVEVCILAEFDCEQVDMLSLVIIGNSQTRIANKYMLTPRGYILS